MGTATLLFRPTIPFAPMTVDWNGTQIKSDLHVELSFPEDSAIQRECQLQGTAIDCEKKIESFTYNDRLKYDDPANWHKVYSLTVYNSDGIRYYLPKNYFVLRLKTTSINEQGPKMFSDVTLHDIKVSE